MKKIFFSLVALAALAACSKSEVEYTDQVQIGFAPVSTNVTKSVAGVGTDGAYDATFPTSLNLYIFANVQDEDEQGVLLNTWTTTYLKNAKFIYNRADLTNTVYEGDPARYWPNVKSLVFAGYSNACNIDDIAANSTMNYVTNTMTINGYIQNNTLTEKGANDLMWFPNSGTAYTRQDAAIPAQMKHACSWITVKVVGDNTTGGNWKLHNLKINDLYHTGTATCTATAASWETSGATGSEMLYENTAGAIINTPAQGAAVMENNANNMVVIPQVPTTIDVTYSFVPQEDIDAIKETKKALSLKFDGDKKWESGKHYIYTITITATEILIAPTVAGWEDVTVNPGTTI